MKGHILFWLKHKQSRFVVLLLLCVFFFFFFSFFPLLFSFVRSDFPKVSNTEAALTTMHSKKKKDATSETDSKVSHWIIRNLVALFPAECPRAFPTHLVPGEVAHFIVMCKLQVGSPLEAMLGVLHEGSAQQLAWVLLWSICAIWTCTWSALHEIILKVDMIWTLGYDNACTCNDAYPLPALI